MTVVDEVGRRNRCTTITFIDFLEAICRLADTISPPPLNDMRRALREALHLSNDAAAAAVLQSSWPYHALYGKVGASPRHFFFDFFFFHFLSWPTPSA